jgi:hypothetical protein
MEAAGHPHKQAVAAALHKAHPEQSPKKKSGISKLLKRKK